VCSAIIFAVATSPVYRSRPPLQDSSTSDTAVSQEHIAIQRKRYAVEAIQQRPFAEPAPNMVSFNLTAMFGAGTVGAKTNYLQWYLRLNFLEHSITTYSSRDTISQVNTQIQSHHAEQQAGIRPKWLATAIQTCRVPLPMRI
jgi:hypothetical protein